MYKWAGEVNHDAIDVVHQLGINAQTTTWGAINADTNHHDWQPSVQIGRLISDGLTAGDIVYTRNTTVLINKFGGS